MGLVRESISLSNFHQNDFTASVGAWEHHLLSGSPQEINDWRAIINPFDQYVWAFLFASTLAVFICLVLINKLYDNWSNIYLGETAFESENIDMHNEIDINFFLITHRFFILFRRSY